MLEKLCLSGRCKQQAHISSQDGLPSSRILWRYRCSSFLLWLLTGSPASSSIWREFRYHRTPLKTNWTKSSGHLSLILLPSTQLRLQSGMSKRKWWIHCSGLSSMPVFFFRCLSVVCFKQQKHQYVMVLQPFLTWYTNTGTNQCQGTGFTKNLQNAHFFNAQLGVRRR